MDFIDTWKEGIKQRASRMGQWLGRLKDEKAPYLTYGSLCGLSLWPLVEASQAGQVLPMMMALGTVAGGVGGNLLANQIENWKKAAEPVDEQTIARWVADNAPTNAELRQALDNILDELQVLAQAGSAVPEKDRQWFQEVLHSEMAQLGNLSRFEASIKGMGAVAQGYKARAALAKNGGMAFVGDIHGDVNIHQSSPGAEEQAKARHKEKAKRRYLEALRRHCQALPLAALGGDEGVDEELTLDRIYIELDTTTLVADSESDESGRIGLKSESFEEREEKRPLTVLEAAARHPRLVILGDPGSGKSSFGKKLLAWVAAAQLGECELPPGIAGDLLPVLVVLRDLVPQLKSLALEEQSEERQKERLAEIVRDQVLADIRRLEADDFAEEAQRAFSKGHSLLVLDGLDEVPQDLRKSVRRATAAVMGRYGARSVLLTCRKRSYTGEAVFTNLTAHTLAPFSRNKIGQFASAWYRAQKDLGRFDEAQAREKARDLTAAALSSDLKELSSNPMLLTTMALIHQREIGLPKERVKLFEQAVEVLLRRWQKRLTGEARLAPSPELTDFLNSDRRLRPVVEHLAYEAHQAGKETDAAADLPRGQALTLLDAPEYLGHSGLAAEFLDYVDQRSGLLVGRGGDLSRPSTYSFPHRTFQEYLAGCHMIGRRNASREFFARAGEGDYWAVAARLGAEELLYNLRRPNELLDLIYRLVPAKKPASEQSLRAVLWAGTLAALIGQDSIARDTESPEGGPEFLGRLTTRLIALLDSPLPPQERAEAGNCLAQLGDPRPGVGRGADGLPDIVWGEVPAGEFVMGSKKNDLSFAGTKETPQRRMELPGFRISRYPITNTQYRAFIEDGGYQVAAYWQAAADEGYWKDGKVEDVYGEEWRDAPADFGVPFNLDNHPVVGVCWYEAVAFVQWLTDRLYRIEAIGREEVITLPTERQWEKAARGPDGFIYPWGKAADPDLANYDDTGIGATSAVGCFPRGASPLPCGAQEMAGNVWEWCLTKFQEDYNNYRDDNDLGGDARRVLRGGSFNFSAKHSRCAARYWDFPLVRYNFIGFRVVLLRSPSSL